MIDNTLLIKNLQKLDELYVIFSQYTRMPYIECDEETYDDQIHIFSSEAEIQEFAKEYTEKKILLMAKKLPKSQAAAVFSSMFGMGINAIIFHHNGTKARLQLEEVAKKPDMEKYAKAQMPIMNPTLTLSVLYFLEEAYRPVEHDKKMLKELEDEMIANLARSRYIIAMSAAKPGEKLDPKNPKQAKGVNYIKDKDGQFYLPVFSTMSEFQGFYREKADGMGMLVLNFEQLTKSLKPDAKGLVLNPAGYRLQISKEQIDKIINK